jgi:hypothetical protein
LGSLYEFEGAEVSEAGISIKDPGRALRDSMGVYPYVIHCNEPVYVVLECQLEDVGHPQIKDSPDLKRHHVMSTVRAAIVDADAVKSLIDDETQRVQLAKEEAAGIRRLDFQTGEISPNHPTNLSIKARSAAP